MNIQRELVLTFNREELGAGVHTEMRYALVRRDYAVSAYWSQYDEFALRTDAPETVVTELLANIQHKARNVRTGNSV